MATVGLNFGSATSGAGFDVSSTVTQILAMESAVEVPWKAQLAGLQAKDVALSGIGTALSTLSTAVSALTNFDGVLASKQGSSSDTNVLTLSSAGSTAVAGSHTVIVTSLAQTSSQFSDRITTASDTLSGSITLQIGSVSNTITLDSTSNTLSTLAQAINSGSYGVKASVVTDTLGSRLSLVSTASGAAGQITLTSNLTNETQSTAVGFQSGQTGKDAKLNVDGLDTSSASNTVTGAIPGVTFQILSAAPNTSLQVQITTDNGSIETAVQTMVTAYNAVVTAMKTQEGKDSTGKAEPLFGDPTLALLQSQLSAALLGGISNGKINSITQLGIALGTDGSLTLNVSELDSTLNTNFSDVEGFFEGSGSFGQNLTSTLSSIGSVSTKGAISLALQQNTAQETDINKNIATLETRMASEKTRLTAELNLANQILQSIPSQLNELSQIYSAVTGYNPGTN
jgi:flagellar hook-associated protein 2